MFYGYHIWSKVPLAQAKDDDDRHEVTNRHKGWPTSRFRTHIKHVTIVFIIIIDS